jgi:hypothetical protein
MSSTSNTTVTAPLVPTSRIIIFYSYVFLLVPSLVCSLLIFYYFIRTPHLRKQTSHRAILLLLIVLFIEVCRTLASPTEMLFVSVYVYGVDLDRCTDTSLLLTRKHCSCSYRWFLSVLELGSFGSEYRRFTFNGFRFVGTTSDCLSWSTTRPISIPSFNRADGIQHCLSLGVLYRSFVRLVVVHEYI